MFLLFFLFIKLARSMVGTGIVRATFRNCFWLQVTKSFVHSPLRSEIQKPKYFQPRLACRFFARLSAGLCRDMAPPDKKDLRMQSSLHTSGYLFSLCGLWLGQVLSEQRSGIVFVPSIMRDLHTLHFLPVGFALIAYLQSGYSLQL